MTISGKPGSERRQRKEFRFSALIACSACFALFAGPALVQDDDCARADALLERPRASSGGAESLLREAVRLCPRHAMALNDLAVIRESQGRLAEAEALYRRAVAADPESAAPYAGLGDVLMAKGDFKRAAEAYSGFLERLQAVKRRGDPLRLARHEDQYRERWQKARMAAAASLGTGAPKAGSLLTAKQITRSLSQPRTRGLRVEGRTPRSIDIPILFDTDADRIRARAWPQIEQIAEALRMPVLQKMRILIEGHTDSTGGEAYNQHLSERRAASVKRALTERFGIQPQRLQTMGFGESRPVASNESESGRFRNRRVTFVNQGQM